MLTLIPIKCFTCGNVIADKYEYYCEEVRKRKLQKTNNKNLDIKKVVYMTKEFSDKTVEGEILDELELNKICCRKHLLTQV